MFMQILLITTVRNIWGTVWRIYTLMLGLKGLMSKQTEILIFLCKPFTQNTEKLGCGENLL